MHDLHATLLHLLGLDHERLSFYHNGIQRRLTDVHLSPRARKTLIHRGPFREALIVAKSGAI